VNAATRIERAAADRIERFVMGIEREPSLDPLMEACTP
jgi:hypothetical protein